MKVLRKVVRTKYRPFKSIAYSIDTIEWMLKNKEAAGVLSVESRLKHLIIMLNRAEGIVRLIVSRKDLVRVVENVKIKKTRPRRNS